KARLGPLLPDGEAQQDGDDPVKQKPTPGRDVIDQGDGDAEQSNDQEERREHEGQTLRGKQRMLKRQESGDPIKEREQQEQEEPVPVASQERRGHLCGGSNEEQDAKGQDGGEGRAKGEADGQGAGDDLDDS